ncbi:DUF3093 domain-containing protein [Lysinibacter cavernae]|uniref:DUF3093 domain-containing protein n=1 Tax=Lysinibacter cavernae TaxID=1640652 RepID=A0A7X5QZ61_9MICO|nr:DUF3093 domain-containing protein [Lysinibacter cavernae]NIH52663.1 hypothetical protein [Lysinibacter cavernae]
MRFYTERLRPGIWMFVAAFLIVPGTMLVLFPISIPAAVISAIVLYVLVAGTLLYSSPTVSVVDKTFTAGRAQISVDQIGEIEAFSGEEATAERGPRSDARSYLMIRGWVDPILKITITDPNDPTPYWLVSTRRPHELADAIRTAQGASTTPSA